jgi:endo-1,4-beta-xylanase
LKDFYRNEFAMGTCYPNGGLTEAEEHLLVGNFSMVTAENLMKPKYLQPAEGEFTFAPADRLVDFAASHGLKVHGHTLVWYQATPGWFFRDGTNLAGRELVLQRMTNHIATVVGHYRGRVASWDVVNEALDDHHGYLRETPWLKAIGEDYIAEAFRAARRADPSARLFYNDYDIESPPKREKVLRLIRSLKAQGVPVDGIGIQGHWRLDRIPYADLAAAITAFQAEGLRVAISELDLDVVPRAGNAAYADYHEAENGSDPFATGCPPEVLARQAEQYGRLFRLLAAHAGAIDRVTFWGLDDGRSWLNYWPRRRTNYPFCWTRDLQPKPALAAVEAAVTGVPAGAQ